MKRIVLSLFMVAMSGCAFIPDHHEEPVRSGSLKDAMLVSAGKEDKLPPASEDTISDMQYTGTDHADERYDQEYDRQASDPNANDWAADGGEPRVLLTAEDIGVVDQEEYDGDVDVNGGYMSVRSRFETPRFTKSGNPPAISRSRSGVLRLAARSPAPLMN